MAAGMTQQQLAEWVHVSSRTIISLEKEQYNPSLLAWHTALRRCSIPQWKSCIACGRTGNWRIRAMKIYYKITFTAV